MATITAGSSKTFTAQVDNSSFVVIAPGGSIGQVVDQNGNIQPIGPNGTRRTFGPLNELQSITVSMQIGNSSVELNGWSGGIPITAETNSTDQTVLDDASRAALQATFTLDSVTFSTSLQAGTLQREAIYTVPTGTFSFCYIGGEYFLNVSGGQNLDLAIAEWSAVVRPIAAENQGRLAGVLTIPSGNYKMSSTSATITLEPWMSVKTMGTVKLDHNAATAPTFWFRNDITPLFSMGNDVATNTTPSTTAETNFANHNVLDGNNGTFIVQGTKTAGSVGIRYGNGDGVWGTNFTTNNVNISMMCAIRGVHFMFLENALQFTNNQNFCSRWENVWCSNCDKTIVTSSSNAEVNSYEQHSFINFFSGNINVTHLEMNSTGSRDHQFSFVHTSFTQCLGPAITLNSASMARLEFTQMRFENNLTVCTSTVASPRSWVRLNNVTIVPTNTYNSLTTHLRKLFVGTFNLMSVNTQFNITGSPAWNTGAYSQPSTQFLADDTVFVQAQNTKVDDPPGDQTTNNNMRRQANWQAGQSLVYNYGFESDLTGWTTGGTGTWSVTTTAGEFVSGAKGVKLVMAAQTGSITTSKFRVRPNGKYFCDLVARIDNGFTTTTCYIIPVTTWYAEDGTTVLRTDTGSRNSTYQNWYNRKSATQFYLDSLGTGVLSAPAGAAFATVAWSVSANTTPGGNLTGTVYIDNVTPFELN